MRYFFILCLVSSLARADEGLDIWQLRCVPCHSEGGAGWLQLSQRSDGVSADLKQRPLTAEQIRISIRQGIGVMPAMSKVELSDQQLSGVIDYLMGADQ